MQDTLGYGGCKMGDYNRFETYIFLWFEFRNCVKNKEVGAAKKNI